MLDRKTVLLFLFLSSVFGSCSMLRSHTGKSTSQIATPSPMSCKISGRIVDILPKPDVDADNICTKYPCTAMVHITDVIACGSSISEKLNAGDTVMIQFAYSLTNTKKSMPTMEAHYPGLKKGDNFLANAEQRLLPGQNAQYLIFGYERLK